MLHPLNMPAPVLECSPGTIFFFLIYDIFNALHVSLVYIALPQKISYHTLAEIGVPETS